MLHQEERRAAQEERRLTRERERRHRRQRAVLEVLGGRPVVEVARSHGVSRQTVHTWRKRYLEQGEAGLEDRSRRPHRSPRRLDDSTVALICSLRREHPGWGAQRLRATLARLGVEPVPSRSTVHRALVRNGLVGAEAAGPAGSRAGSPPPSPPPCPSASASAGCGCPATRAGECGPCGLCCLGCPHCLSHGESMTPSARMAPPVPERRVPRVTLFESPPQPVSRISGHPAPAEPVRSERPVYDSIG